MPDADRCPECGDPRNGPALMHRCANNHTQPKEKSHAIVGNGTEH